MKNVSHFKALLVALIGFMLTAAFAVGAGMYLELSLNTVLAPDFQMEKWKTIKVGANVRDVLAELGPPFEALPPSSDSGLGLHLSRSDRQLGLLSTTSMTLEFPLGNTTRRIVQPLYGRLSYSLPRSSDCGYTAYWVDFDQNGVVQGIHQENMD